ncbi:adenylate/guanylate cyclase domain-containing protein [Bradyrhizobium sp.]|uniref:adenylate/guanylate cyclase domain-containing protein n=1 Tax=Bradyrhizobium sp. TaxID=376 RepID=UPI002629E795|nr:adenylate/guanylate cyclase domain-containing protein [Bradyrhizobium sp.]
MDASELDKLVEWLTDGARSAKTSAALLEQTCERLVAAGVPLYRVGAFVTTPHPDLFGRAFIWRRGSEVVVNTANFDLPSSPQFTQSPLILVYRSLKAARFRMDDPEIRRFPLFDDLRKEGVTDYIALPMLFTDDSVHVASWTTKEPTGFGEEHLIALRRIIGPFARLGEIFAQRRIASTLLDTYVGNSAGERILAGQIRRGHTEAMQTVIWLSDLRGFTALSDRLPAETVVEILNRYFDCQVASIKSRGGEILKYMGDGLLAVFPVDQHADDVGKVCSGVLDAAREARANVEAMQFPIGETVERFRFGVALHVGRVLYGNIGGGNRLDFTCIGPAVNLAARLEKIASRLHRTVIASHAFVEACANSWQDSWQDLGEFPIAGFTIASRVYGLRDEAGTQASQPAVQ